MPEKKLCEKCNIEVSSANCIRHLKSKTHLKNDPDQTTQPPCERPKNCAKNVMLQLQNGISI